MEMSTSENGKMIKKKGMDSISKRMVIHTMESGRTVSCMEEVCILRLMETNMLGNLLKTNSLAMEYVISIMETYIKVNGWTGIIMEKGNI